MSGSRWVTTPSWLTGSLRPFLYSSSVYSYHLFLTSSASVRSLLLLSFIVPIFVWNVSLVSPIFLKRSLVLLFYYFLLFLCIVHIRLSYLSTLFSETLHSIVYFFPFLFCISCLFAQLFVRFLRQPLCLVVSVFGMVLVTVVCTMLWISAHSSLCTLSTRFFSLVEHNSSASWISLPGYSPQWFK